MKSLVSIIVACYNHGQFLTEAIESVLAQTYNNWECIIINDGSTDNTHKVAQQLLKRDERISYYKINNSGVSFARNYAIEKSNGYFILPFDADDILHPAYIDKAVKIFEQKDVKLVYCDIQLFGAEQGLFDLPDYSEKEFAIMNMILGNSVFKKNDFITAGGYNTNMLYGWEDWNLFIAFLKNGGRVVKIPEALFYYRIQPGSRTKHLEGVRKQKMYMQLYLNHPDFFDKHYAEPVEIFPQYQHLKSYNKTLLEHINFLKGLMLLRPSAYRSLGKKLQKKFLTGNNKM